MTSSTEPSFRALIIVTAVSVALACGGESPTGNDGGSGNVTAQDVSLSVGQSATFPADGEVLALRLPSASSGREYRLTVQSTSTGTPDQVIPMRLTRGDGSSGSGSVSTSRRAASFEGDVPPRARDLTIRQKIRESSRELLIRRGIRPARSSDSGTGPGGDVRLSSQVPTGSTPSEGDTIQFWFTADSSFNTTCSTIEADEVTAVVEEVGDRAAIVQDTAAPDGGVTGGGFSTTDFQDIATTFDTLVVPVDSAYFGTPTDIDNNERVYILFTPKVNELDPDDSSTRVGGFFVPNDLAESGDLTGSGSDAKTCAASNEAELLYLRAPDPNGNWGNATTADEARTNAYSVSSHELQHLLNAANRVIKNQNGDFGDLETTWLSEALSHVAEEVAGLAAYDAAVRSNLTFSETGDSSSETFNTYLINDFYNAGQFMQSSADARALSVSDPGGRESLEMRGFGWLFVRWLADQHAASVGNDPVPNSGEETFFRDLAQAGGNELATGIDNVEAVTGATFADLLDDFDVMVAVDDDVAEAGGAQVLPTWDLRNMYRELAANTGSGWPYGDYPLNPVESGFTDGVTDFEVRPGPGKHFTISSSGSTPELEIRLTDQTGSALSSSAGARIVIFRAR